MTARPVGSLCAARFVQWQEGVGMLSSRSVVAQAKHHRVLAQIALERHHRGAHPAGRERGEHRLELGSPLGQLVRSRSHGGGRVRRWSTPTCSRSRSRWTGRWVRRLGGWPAGRRTAAHRAVELLQWPMPAILRRSGWATAASSSRPRRQPRSGFARTPDAWRVLDGRRGVLLHTDGLTEARRDGKQ
jgi:hypothetical protein